MDVSMNMDGVMTEEQKMECTAREEETFPGFRHPV